MNTRNIARWLMAGFLISSVLSAAVARGKVFQGTQARASSTAIKAKQTAVQPVFSKGR
jgi:hypothetical protein